MITVIQPGAVGFTVSQPSEGLEVIRDRAEELGLSSIAVSPKFSTYPNPSSDEGYCRHHIAGVFRVYIILHVHDLHVYTCG